MSAYPLLDLFPYEGTVTIPKYFTDKDISIKYHTELVDSRRQTLFYIPKTINPFIELMDFFLMYGNLESWQENSKNFLVTITCQI